MVSKILYPNTSMEWAFTPHRARRAGAGKWLEGWEVGKTRPDGGLPAVCGRTPSPRQAAPSKARPACGAWAHELGGVGADCPLAGWGALQIFSTSHGRQLSQSRPPPSSPRQRPRRRRSRHEGRLGARGAGKARPGGWVDKARFCSRFQGTCPQLSPDLIAPFAAWTGDAGLLPIG